MPNSLVTDSALIALIMPGIIAALNREKWSSQVKAVAAFVICLVAAAGVAWWNNDLNWHDYRVAAATVFGATLGLYHAVWKPSGLADSVSKGTG